MCLEDKSHRGLPLHDIKPSTLFIPIVQQNHTRMLMLHFTYILRIDEISDCNMQCDIDMHNGLYNNFKKINKHS